MTRTRAMWIMATLLVLSARPALADFAMVTIDHVSVRSGGRHRVWISVLDDRGLPILDQRPEQFSLEEDLVHVPDFDLITYAGRYPRVVVTVIADPDLVRRQSPISMRPLLQALRKHLSSQDRLRVVSARDRFPSTELPEGTDEEGINLRLQPLEANALPRMLDATAREIERARRERDGNVLLLVTAGGRGAIQSRILNVLAMLRDRDRPATISLIQLGDSLSGRDRDRLMRLVVRSGGGSRTARTTADLAEGGIELLARARGAYLLNYQFRDWEPAIDRHNLRIKFRMQGRDFAREIDFSTGDVSSAPWWAIPQPWIVACLLLSVATAAGFWVMRPRPLCRLLVESGGDRGCTYEILEVPIRIGTIEGNDLILDEPQVSRNHALLIRRRGGFDLLDSNSENGTYVNGSRIVRHSLTRGDRISIGPVTFRFSGPR